MLLRENRNKILISSMGRSGSTWLCDLINYKQNFKEVFEPFFPARVEEAKPFGYYNFLEPSNNDKRLKKAAQKLLSGDLTNRWVNSGNKSKHGVGILIKSIRTNLMLRWLKYNFSEIRIILLIRDPFEVAESWMRLGWSKIPFQEQSDLDVILGQMDLRTRFPEIAAWFLEYRDISLYESIILEWCILNYVPLEQLKNQPDLFLTVNYNEIIANPSTQLQRIFDFLEEDFNSDILNHIGVKSRTTFDNVNSNFKTSETDVINGLRIINLFELDKFIIKGPEAA